MSVTSDHFNKSMTREKQQDLKVSVLCDHPSFTNVCVYQRRSRLVKIFRDKY